MSSHHTPQTLPHITHAYLDQLTRTWSRKNKNGLTKGTAKRNTVRIKYRRNGESRGHR